MESKIEDYWNSMPYSEQVKFITNNSENKNLEEIKESVYHQEKLELIKNTYGEFYDEVKEYLDENGWCKLNISQKHPINSFAHSQNKTEWKPVNGVVCWRPRSLSKIY